MNRKDKDQFLIVAFIIAFLGLSVSFFIIGKKVNSLYLGIAIILIQQIFILPSFARGVGNMFGVEIGLVRRFMPVVNEISILHPVAGSIMGFASAIIVICTGAVFINSDFIIKLFGERAVFRYTTSLLWVAIFSYIVLDFARGFGYNKLYRVILRDYDDNFGSNKRDGWGWVSKLSYLFFYIPIVRNIGLIYASEKVNKLVIINNIKATQDAKSYLEEE